MTELAPAAAPAPDPLGLTSGGGGGPPATTDRQIEKWGLCLLDCPYEEPQVSCLAPPPVPVFGKRNASGTILVNNYMANWFTLSFINTTDAVNQTHYRLTRKQRNRLYQPDMEYDASQLLDTDLEMVAENSSAHLNDLYDIVPEGGTAIYTCPEGWVFENSTNVTHIAYCSNWTWTADFNISAGCVSKSNC